MAFDNIKNEIKVLNEIVSLIHSYESNKTSDLSVGLLEIEAENQIQGRYINLLAKIILDCENRGEIDVIRRTIESYVSDLERQASKDEVLFEQFLAASSGEAERLMKLPFWDGIIGDGRGGRLEGIWDNKKVSALLLLSPSDGYEVIEVTVNGEKSDPSILY